MHGLLMLCDSHIGRIPLSYLAIRMLEEGEPTLGVLALSQQVFLTAQQVRQTSEHIKPVGVLRRAVIANLAVFRLFNVD